MAEKGRDVQQTARWGKVMAIPEAKRDSLRKGIRDLVVPFVRRVDELREVRSGDKIKFR